MAVKIRLQRFGAKKRPYYRIVRQIPVTHVTECLEQVGTYNPMLETGGVTLVQDRFDYWVSVGAQPSSTVASLVRRLKRAAAE